MSSESNFSFTTKVNGDLLTVRGDTIDGFINNLLGAAAVSEIANLLSVLQGVAPTEQQAAQNVVQAFNGQIVQQPPAPQVVPQQGFPPVAPPTIPQPLQAGAPMCQHGQRTAKKGTGKTGEWRAYMCPTPKGTADQCQPIWLQKGSPEWNSFVG